MTLFDCINGSVTSSVTTTKIAKIRIAAEKFVSSQMIHFFCVDGTWLVDVEDANLSVAQKAQLVVEVKNATN